ncbi:MAG TPA: hypothetical protein VGM67_06890 [Gemmatimonadaceae bacterium]
MISVIGPGGWRVDLDAEFRLIDNGDSIQAVAGDRVAYLSATRVGDPTGPPAAAQLRRIVSRTMQSAERFQHSEPTVEGEAEIRGEPDSFALHGFMCAAGSLATCVISFGKPQDAAWAQTVWRSLNHVAS